MNQAILQSISENGEVESWNYFIGDVTDEDGNKVNQTDKNDASFQKYLAPYLKNIEKRESKDSNGNKIYLYFLADGSAFSFAQHENRDILFFPKNPEKCLTKQDHLGTCSFSFEFYPISNSNDWKYHYKKGMEAALYKWDSDERKLYTGTAYSCTNSSSNNNMNYCTAIIQRNGWKIPKDYPRRISF